MKGIKILGIIYRRFAPIVYLRKIISVNVPIIAKIVTIKMFLLKFIPETVKATEQVNVAVRFNTCIREVLCSIPCRDTAYND